VTPTNSLWAIECLVNLKVHQEASNPFSRSFTILSLGLLELWPCSRYKSRQESWPPNRLVAPGAQSCSRNARIAEDYGFVERLSPGRSRNAGCRRGGGPYHLPRHFAWSASN